MKNKIFTKFLFILSLATVISCSKSEENTPLDGGIISSLILTSSSADGILVVDESVTFTAMGDNDVDYTADAIFYVNDTEIQGASYDFTEEGVFSVYATFSGVTSNVLEYDVLNASGRSVQVDVSKAFKNQTITFLMFDVDGNDVTNEATFYVDGNEIAGNTFSSDVTAIYEVYATYEIAGESFETPIKNFEIFVPKRKVVVEDYTGTWCGYCPRVLEAIHHLEEVTHDITVVAIHETANSFPDPMHFDQVQVLKDEFGVDGLPAARLNRTTTWQNPYETADVLAMAGTEADLSIAINSQLNGDALTISVSTLFENGSNPGDKLVVYLLESGIIYDQVNYLDNDPTSQYYQQGNPIPNFEHNHVLRQNVTQLFGNEIDATEALGVYTEDFLVTIPAEYNSANLSIAAMLVSSDNTARNSQFASVNEAKDFE